MKKYFFIFKFSFLILIFISIVFISGCYLAEDESGTDNTVSSENITDQDNVTEGTDENSDVQSGDSDVIELSKVTASTSSESTTVYTSSTSFRTAGGGYYLISVIGKGGKGGTGGNAIGCTPGGGGGGGGAGSVSQIVMNLNIWRGQPVYSINWTMNISSKTSLELVVNDSNYEKAASNGGNGDNGSWEKGGAGATYYGRGGNGTTSVPWQCFKGDPKGRSGGGGGSNGTAYGKGGSGGRGGDIGASWGGKTGSDGKNGAIIVEQITEEEYERIMLSNP